MAQNTKNARTSVEDGYEKDMLDKLAMLARGTDIYGQQVPRSEMLAAQQQYFELKSRVENRRLERDKLDSLNQVEHRRLDIEEERVRVQKAEVIVKALEVAVKGGADPQQLLIAIQGLSQNLLPENPVTTRLLEKK